MSREFQQATLAAMSDDTLISTYLAWLTHYRRGEDRNENRRLLRYAWEEARGRGLEGRIEEAVKGVALPLPAETLRNPAR